MFWSPPRFEVLERREVVSVYPCMIWLRIDPVMTTTRLSCVRLFGYILGRSSQIFVRVLDDALKKLEQQSCIASARFGPWVALMR